MSRGRVSCIRASDRMVFVLYSSMKRIYHIHIGNWDSAPQLPCQLKFFENITWEHVLHPFLGKSTIAMNIPASICHVQEQSFAEIRSAPVRLDPNR